MTISVFRWGVLLVLGLCHPVLAASGTLDIRFRRVDLGRTGRVHLDYTKADGSPEHYSIRAQIGRLVIQTRPNTATGAGQAIVDAHPSSSISAWCADVLQMTSRRWNTYGVISPYEAPRGGDNSVIHPNGMGRQKARDLARLFASHLGKVTDGNTAAAFQMSVWEIINENSGTYDVLDGRFWTSTNGSWAHLANTWLQDSLGEDTVGLLTLTHSTHQDFVTQATVPEPLTFVGVGLCAVAAGMYVRKRRGERA